VAVAILLTEKEPLVTSLLFVAFIADAVVTVLLASRSVGASVALGEPQPPRVGEATSSQGVGR
jgi:Flp pilus assembly protein protease CpaA